MPQTPHIERHFTASEVVRDIVIGMSDGLTVPFALAAGLTGGLAGQPNEEETRPIVQALRKQPKNWIDFMMRFELGLERPDPKRATVSAFTIGGAYVAGGFIPLTPYIVMNTASTALLFSIAVTLLALLLFGFVKGRFTGMKPLRSALQTAFIGSVAAGAAFAIARVISE